MSSFPCTCEDGRWQIVDGLEIDEHSVVIADLFWRDATLILPRTMVQS